mmetsp:Transcript_16724/g.11872  ORF Transcript_16724/g.11872 Transcript_16724/m.11872 type:complete len:103 (+) Transcript_16724:112-420(+)
MDRDKYLNQIDHSNLKYSLHDDIKDLTKAWSDIKLPGMFARPMYQLKTYTAENGPLSSDFQNGIKKMHPIVFSHGYNGFCVLYTCLLSELASYGYVVFSMGH